MINIQKKNIPYKCYFEKNNEKFSLEMINKEKKIIFNIFRENSIPSTLYSKEYTLEDLQKIAKYFKVFDYIDEAFGDIKNKLDKKEYEIISDEIDKKIEIKIKTNIYNSDFSLDVPVKILEPEKIIKDLCVTIKKHDNEIKELLKIKEPEKQFEKLEEKIKKLEDLINLKIKEKKESILFEKSTIIKKEYERKLLESFIKENDSSKKEIYPILLYKATVDGDNADNFHQN